MKTNLSYSGKVGTWLLAMLLVFSISALQAQDKDTLGHDLDQEQVVDMEKREGLKQDAQEAKQAFIAKDPSLQEHLDNSVGYVIFPNVGKGAWILGGAAGNGVVYENGEVAGFAELRQVDIGFQFGGQAFREIIIFRTQEAMDKFKQGDFSFEGSASAVVWDEGEGKSIQFENGVGVALMPKAGAMVGISVGGQEFDFRAVD